SLCLLNDFVTDAITGKNCNCMCHNAYFSLFDIDLSAQPGTALEPGMARQTLSFELADLIGAPQCQPDVVKAIEQTVFAKGIYLKSQFPAIGSNDHLTFKVNAQLIAIKGTHFVEQAGHFQFGKHDRQQAVLEAVVKKDIGI